MNHSPQEFHRMLWLCHWVPVPLCTDRNLSGQCGPESPRGCSLASSLCENRQVKVRPHVRHYIEQNQVLSSTTTPLGGTAGIHIPVNYVQWVEVSECTSYFSSIKPCPGLQKHPLTLEVIEQLQEKNKCHEFMNLVNYFELRCGFIQALFTNLASIDVV